MTTLSLHLLIGWYLAFVATAKFAGLSEALFSWVTGGFPRGTPKLGPACITGVALHAKPVDGMNLHPSVPRIVDQRSPQGELGAYRRQGKMAAVAGHQLHHEVPVSLLLVGEQLPVLLVRSKLVVYIAVFGQVLRKLRIIYFAGYSLAGIEHEEAIRAPYAF